MKYLFITIFSLISVNLYAQDDASTSKIRWSFAPPMDERTQRVDSLNKADEIKKSKEMAEGQAQNDSLYKAFLLAKKQKIIKQHGLATWKRIEKHQVWVGMTEDMCLFSIGRPDDDDSYPQGKAIIDTWLYYSCKTSLIFKNKVCIYLNEG
ncbi:MAG: hypothetical protein P4L41_03450 [Flavipsychrobacter sp.]|nr:hypothetical protein [Flavipsychrobacter sp.]